MTRWRQAARMGVTLVLVAGAAALCVPVWNYYMNAPWTRDGRVAADVVGVAPDVSGLVSAVAVADNQVVRRGDVLFRIDPARFELAVRQADAVVAERQADMVEAAREAERSRKLDTLSVTEEKQQQRESVAARAVAMYRQAVADRDVAVLNAQRAVVRSPVDGVVSNFDVRPGDYAAAGHSVVAVIDSDTLRVDGYFEETKLHAIHVGDAATVHLMGSRGVLHGRVESVSAGVENRDRTAGGLLADINPTFSWVRLAQRIPVRVVFDHVPADAGLVVGRTATVAIQGRKDVLFFKKEHLPCFYVGAPDHRRPALMLQRTSRIGRTNHRIWVAAIRSGLGQMAANAARKMASPPRNAAQTKVRRRMAARKLGRDQLVSKAAAASGVAQVVSRAR